MVGHHDAAEPSGHSGLRATALVHFIRNEKQAWVAIAAQWGRVRDTQQLLSYLRQERGWNVPTAAITDVADAATGTAVLAFQREANARLGAALFEDGIIGAQTLGAIFDVAREDWTRWLTANAVADDDLAFEDPSCPAIAAGVGFKPYRTVPPLPAAHGHRFVDAIIVPATERVELGRSPAGAGVYDVASIGTLAPGDLVWPHADVFQLRFFDPDHRPVPDLEVTATLDGVTMPAKTTDVDGVVTFALPADVRLASVELGPRLGYATQGGIVLERGDGEDGEPFAIPDIAEQVARLFTSHPVEILVFPPSVDVPAEPAAPPPTVVAGTEFGPDNPYRLDELSTFWRHGKTGEAFALTDGELELKRATYRAHIRRAVAERREFVASVPRAELTRIGGTRHRLRTIAAASFEAMWTAMAAALEADRAAAVGTAVATTSVGLVDGYRDADEQFTMWDGRFYGYLWSFKKHELKDETAATSTVVPKELARYIGGKTGCPGYSNHNDGHAIDIETKVLSAKGKAVRLGAKNRKLWLEIRPWMFDWMSEHCGEHGFEPYEREPWHWNYVGALEGAVPGAEEDSRC
ncbi:MAG: D-alanyl-D-alanine carboxypeptidase family protein [Deltaproteobacteria bacterium]|nr:D-alanyl-D-alanine carboxypeptidase family protein [Nannocystaceae bacterium]